MMPSTYLGDALRPRLDHALLFQLSDPVNFYYRDVITNSLIRSLNRNNLVGLTRLNEALRETIRESIQEE
jgi:hypothetical protein